MLKSGERRYVPRYRIGGADTPVVHGGTFKTMKAARIRLEFIRCELAAGRDPRDSLQGRRDAPLPSHGLTVAVWGERWLASRRDVAPNTQKAYRKGAGKVNE